MHVATYPTFEYGTQAIIAGTTTTIEKTNPYWTDVVAEGTAISPTLKDTETLFVDGVQINFDKKVDYISAGFNVSFIVSE